MLRKLLFLVFSLLVSSTVSVAYQGGLDATRMPPQSQDRRGTNTAERWLTFTEIWMASFLTPKSLGRNMDLLT